MRKKEEKGAYLARQITFAEMENSHQLDAYVHQMLTKKTRDLCGILISAHIGTGKTFFVENYLKGFESAHPVLTARHYQQHEKIPYFGFKNSISDYLSNIYNQFSKAEFQKFSGSLKEYLGESFPLLLEYIPELSLINGQESGFPQRTMLAIENQLYPLVKRLFEFLADYYQKPVFFFTDDLQWIDVSGTNLLKHLLLDLAPEKLVWIGACRAPQSKISSLRQLGEEIGFQNRRIENIFLKGLNREETRKFIERMLGSYCQDGFIDICYKLSTGNPSHLQVLLKSLSNSDFIWLQKGVWHCDRAAIERQYAGQNAEGILLERFDKLSVSAREILSLMACLGRFNRRIMLNWLQEDEGLMSRLLQEAENAGLLEQVGNDLRFSEMHIGEMIYNGLSPGRRSELHYKIASLFYSRGLDNLSTTELILMTTSFNQSLEWVKSKGELKRCAELNFKAGKLSEQDNALDQTRYFFKMSADLLKECPWEQVAEQGWQVYMERARVEYYLGEYDLAEIHLDYLLSLVPDPLKRAKAFELKVTINNHLGRYRKVVRILKESLGELGLELPLDEQQLQQEVAALKRLLARQEDRGGQLPAAGSLDEDSREAILKLLYVGGMGLHHTSDVLMSWAALQIIIRSGTDTSSGVKAIGFVSYGRMLIISGDIEKGYEFGLKGLKINNLLDDIRLRCRVYGVYAFYIQPWKKAFADSIELLEQGIKAGRETNDLIGLYILKTHRLNLHLISGLPLQELLQWDFEESYQGMELTYYITHYQKSLVQFLVGENPVFSIPRQEPSWLAAKLTIQEEKFYRNYVWAGYYFLFGHYELAARAAREANENRKLQEGSPLVPANLFVWFLSITQTCSDFTKDLSEALRDELAKILKDFGWWRRHAPLNYTSSCCLLHAEWARIKGKEAKALEQYKEAIQTSGTNVYQGALAHELLARYLLTLPGEKQAARFHLSEAIRFFTAWGAVAKVKQLIQQYQSVLLDEYPDGQGMDIETIQQELSGDMEVASLIKKLMVLLLRISGSTRVVVELSEEKGALSCYGDFSLLYSEKETSPEAGSSPDTGIPISMVLMSHRAQKTIVVNDLASENGLRDLEAIQARDVQSFLILPVTLNGHLSMVIYLENSFAKNWYTQELIRWIRITANQGAVIIENGRTHEKSVKLNEEILKEMTEKERLASLIEAQKDAHLKELVQMQENERKRIASDLHDSLGSLLSSVKLRFNGLGEDFGRIAPQKLSRFNSSVALLDDAIYEVRRIAHNMSPVSLSRFGLKAVLQTFVEQLNASGKLKADIQILGLNRRLPEQIELAVYRICQELVQNVLKHASTLSMSIQLIDHQDSLNLIVEDKGIGMKQNEVSLGLGFMTIQSKVKLFKGTFAIESQPGKGTMVLIDIPLDES